MDVAQTPQALSTRAKRLAPAALVAAGFGLLTALLGTTPASAQAPWDYPPAWFQGGEQPQVQPPPQPPQLQPPPQPQPEPQPVAPMPAHHGGASPYLFFQPGGKSTYHPSKELPRTAPGITQFHRSYVFFNPGKTVGLPPAAVPPAPRPAGGGGGGEGQPGEPRTIGPRPRQPLLFFTPKGVGGGTAPRNAQRPADAVPSPARERPPEVVAANPRPGVPASPTLPQGRSYLFFQPKTPKAEPAAARSPKEAANRPKEKGSVPSTIPSRPPLRLGRAERRPASRPTPTPTPTRAPRTIPAPRPRPSWGPHATTPSSRPNWGPHATTPSSHPSWGPHATTSSRPSAPVAPRPTPTRPLAPIAPRPPAPPLQRSPAPNAATRPRPVPVPAPVPIPLPVPAPALGPTAASASPSYRILLESRKVEPLAITPLVLPELPPALRSASPVPARPVATAIPRPMGTQALDPAPRPAAPVPVPARPVPSAITQVRPIPSPGPRPQDSLPELPAVSGPREPSLRLTGAAR